MPVIVSNYPTLPCMVLHYPARGPTCTILHDYALPCTPPVICAFARHYPALRQYDSALYAADSYIQHSDVRETSMGATFFFWGRHSRRTFSAEHQATLFSAEHVLQRTGGALLRVSFSDVSNLMFRKSQYYHSIFIALAQNFSSY